jgi:glycosyltransferase involved in cell wall biosynthesis
VHVSCFEDRSKNISGLLRVTGRLTKERNDFRVVFVGEGADYERMTELAGQTGLKDRVVFFAGLLEGEALVHNLQAADFMVISSHYENLPVVISEAFACGLPVLSTDVGGIAEILTKDRGKLVPPGDDGALLDGLRFMLDHVQDFHPEKIREFAVDYCSREKVSQQLKALYYQALGIPWQ